MHACTHSKTDSDSRGHSSANTGCTPCGKAMSSNTQYRSHASINTIKLYMLCATKHFATLLPPRMYKLPKQTPKHVSGMKLLAEKWLPANATELRMTCNKPGTHFEGARKTVKIATKIETYLPPLPPVPSQRGNSTSNLPNIVVEHTSFQTRVCKFGIAANSIPLHSSDPIKNAIL